LNSVLRAIHPKSENLPTAIMSSRWLPSARLATMGK